MSDNIKWLVPDAVIYHKFLDNHNKSDIKEANETLITMINSSPQQEIHYVMDVRQLKMLANGDLFDSIQSSRPFFSHPKLGWTVAFGSKDRGMRFAGRLVTGVLRAQVQIFEHQDDAYDFLIRLNPEFQPYLMVE